MASLDLWHGPCGLGKRLYGQREKVPVEDEWRWNDIAVAVWRDLQNTHYTVWSSYGNPKRIGAYHDFELPQQYKRYLTDSKYSTPSGLMELMR